MAQFLSRSIILRNNLFIIVLRESIFVLDEEPRSIVSTILSILVILIPLIALTFVYFENRSIDSEINYKQRIIQLSNQIIGLSKNLSHQSAQVFSPTPMAQKGDFTALIESTLTLIRDISR